VRDRAVQKRCAALLVVAAAIGCNAISGIDDFSASDPTGGASGASASGGASATGGEGGTAGSGGAAGAGSGGTSGTAGASGAAGDAGTAGDAGSAGDAGADVAGQELCSGGIDDDADGKIDCFDSDCRDDTACAGFCSDAETLPCNVVRRMQNSSGTGSTARIGPPLYGCGGGKDEPGPEYAYRLNVPEGQRVFVELFGLDTDLSAYVVDVAKGAQCDARSGCVAAGASASGTLPEGLTFSSAADRDYYVVVDGPSAGAYWISIQCSPTSSDGCIPARPIQAGPQTVMGSQVLGSAPNVTQKLLSYTCGGGSRGAPEAAFMFTPVVDGSYRVDLTASTADLFVLTGPQCNGVCVTPNSSSTNPAGLADSVTFAATAGTTYYIVVDSYSPSASFTLGVTQL
jgi:hypothetical protein